MAFRSAEQRENIYSQNGSFDSALAQIEDTLRVYEEKYFSGQRAYHYLVGGPVADRIAPHTLFDIDPQNKIIDVHNDEPLTLIRDDGTVKDADMVVCWPDRHVFIHAEQTLRAMQNESRTQGIPFPLVSLEPTGFPDWFKKPIGFVTGMEVQEDGNMYLTFNSIAQKVSWESVEPWTMRIGSGQEFSVFNPFAWILRYASRAPSGIKPKDRQIKGEYIADDGTDLPRRYSKLSLMGGVAVAALAAGREQGIDYLTDDYYKPWVDFILTMHKSDDMTVKMLREVARYFWKKPGTKMAHGSHGLMSDWIASLGNHMGQYY